MNDVTFTRKNDAHAVELALARIACEERDALVDLCEQIVSGDLLDPPVLEAAQRLGTARQLRGLIGTLVT